MRFAWTFACVALLTVIAAPSANAQLWRNLDLTDLDGEPSDPDGALAILADANLDLAGYGISASEPTTESEKDSWWEVIIHLMLELGLISGDTD